MQNIEMKVIPCYSFYDVPFGHSVQFWTSTLLPLLQTPHSMWPSLSPYYLFSEPPAFDNTSSVISPYEIPDKHKNKLMLEIVISSILQD